MNDITEREHTLMTHATAADERRKGKRGFRNYFCAAIGGDDYKVWVGLVARGLAREGHKINQGRDQYFMVTELGCKLIGLSGKALKRAMGAD